MCPGKSACDAASIDRSRAGEVYKKSRVAVWRRPLMAGIALNVGSVISGRLRDGSRFRSLV
jgi:hypothetical protein